ncbi:twin-arginine translocation signal domain-containing protein [Saccharopolyspora shandongensis]|uniref:twin-arginine translocation signal domain-containing protein n=1 Tax=Saccharopolyspora shandongensis TaxID=418495 RepID=UPI0033D79AE9
MPSSPTSRRNLLGAALAVGGACAITGCTSSTPQQAPTPHHRETAGSWSAAI